MTSPAPTRAATIVVDGAVESSPPPRSDRLGRRCAGPRPPPRPAARWPHRRRATRRRPAWVRGRQRGAAAAADEPAPGLTVVDTPSHTTATARSPAPPARTRPRCGVAEAAIRDGGAAPGPARRDRGRSAPAPTDRAARSRARAGCVRSQYPTAAAMSIRRSAYGERLRAARGTARGRGSLRRRRHERRATRLAEPVVRIDRAGAATGQSRPASHERPGPDRLASSIRSIRSASDRGQPGHRPVAPARAPSAGRARRAATRRRRPPGRAG